LTDESVKRKGGFMNKLLVLVILSIFMLVTNVVCGVAVANQEVVTAASRARHMYYGLAGIGVTSITLILLFLKVRRVV